VLGRTDWDRNALQLLSPQTCYHYGGEILRPEFYEAVERSLPAVPVITTTISLPTYKGLDLLLRVAHILKNELHFHFQWNVYGRVDAPWAERLTGIRHGDVNVHLCGLASASQLHDALAASTLYFHPSYIENSPNSVCEAQLTGIPVVATNVGGTSSLVTHDETGYLFPATDPYMGAYYVQQLITDTSLNHAMGHAARTVALQRHDKEKIVSELLSTYQSLISDVR